MLKDLACSRYVDKTLYYNESIAAKQDHNYIINKREDDIYGSG